MADKTEYRLPIHYLKRKQKPELLLFLPLLNEQELEEVLLFRRYLVTDPGESLLKAGRSVSEEEYRERERSFPELRVRMETGADGILSYLGNAGKKEAERCFSDTVFSPSEEMKEKAERFRALSRLNASGVILRAAGRQLAELIYRQCGEE